MKPSTSAALAHFPLVKAINQVFILAYKESTQLLESTFVREGFACEVLRQEHQPEYRDYSRSYLCLLNHVQAWQKASQAEGLTLIVEADFVPVAGMGQLPLPCNPNQPNLGITWLYTCAPQVYSVSKEGFAEGFSTAMVAYIVTPQTARYLIELAEEIRQKYGSHAYTTWDSGIDGFLRSHALKNYIPFRNYGEHGGRPNPEHRQNGLSPAHRADVLYGRLAFVPPYAIDQDKPNAFQYLWARTYARIKGIGRLLMGKFLRLKVLRTSSVPLRLLSFTIRRQLWFGL